MNVLCRLVGCHQKVEHQAHPSTMSAPSEETWQASQQPESGPFHQQWMAVRDTDTTYYCAGEQQARLLVEAWRNNGLQGKVQFRWVSDWQDA